MADRLLEIFKEEHIHIYEQRWNIIMEETKWVSISGIELHEWEQIQHLCILPEKWNRFDINIEISDECCLSHDNTWLIVFSDSIDINSILRRCERSLRYLRIEKRIVSPLDVSSMKELRFLHVGEEFDDSGTVMHISGLDQLSLLETLHLDGVFDFPVLNIANLKDLKDLHILDNQRLEKITGLVFLTKLKKLALFRVNAMREIAFSGLRKLEHLELGEMQNLERISDFNHFSNLRYLYLYDIPVDLKRVDLSNMKKLISASFKNISTLQHIHGLEYLNRLDRLDISETSIRNLPDALKNAPLKRLNLSELELEYLPDWLPELGLDFHLVQKNNGIILENTIAKDVDMSIFKQPREMIVQWFEERKAGNDVPLNEIKVVFLGNGEVGKSHTIARLLNAGEHPKDSFTGSSTPGIAIENKEYDIAGQKVQIHFWDFGGQDILYSMHRMFLTKRTLYVILVDARNESKGNQAREWLDSVKSFAEDAPVLLVVNKTDQNPAASIDEETLYRKYKNLKKVVYMSALTATKDEFNTKFTDSMLELIRQSGSLEIKWPRKWTQVKAGLQNMQAPYIFSDAYEALCQECDVNENQINLLEWFNDLGVSFCQFRDYNLKDFVILRPDWMTNAIYTILFNKREEVENGMISLEEISNLLNPTPETRERIRQVVSDVKYNWQEINYVLDVVRKFRLSYSVNRDMEFFPMLCKENSKPIAQEYANSTDSLEFQMKFEYLPNNVLHRLMVERWSELDKDNVWLTGARFVQPNTGLSAVVRIDGNVLQIYVKSENELHSRNTYLSIIEGSIDQIRQELKLPKPRNHLVYKVDNRRAEFDYERLLKMHAKGKETEYSHELDEDFPIWDILNQFAPAESTEQERLLADLVKACGQLQAEKHYWETKENPRNSYIRNALDNMGYVLRDQTLRGISGGETEEGELDLDIRKYKDVPWTICEALRVDSGSKTDWNFHLKKLLDNYNPNGVRFLILLTYVDDEKNKFDQIWNSFKNHIQGHDGGGFAYQLDSFKHYQTELWTNNHYIQTARCKYVLSDYTPTVYHIFVRMGR